MCEPAQGPTLGGKVFGQLIRQLRNPHTHWPPFGTSLWFMCAIAGSALATWPRIDPGKVGIGFYPPPSTNLLVGCTGQIGTSCTVPEPLDVFMNLPIGS